jgi:hypothetical protein
MLCTVILYLQLFVGKRTWAMYSHIMSYLQLFAAKRTWWRQESPQELHLNHIKHSENISKHAATLQIYVHIL